MGLWRNLLLVCALVFASPALAAPKGTIFITPKQIDTASPTFEKDLKRAARTSLAKEGDRWNIFFIAYLKKAAGAEEVHLVFYDTSGAKREQVNHFPIATSATAEILASNVTIAVEQGFKVGRTYQVLVTRLIHGKEDVYAKTLLTLK